MGRRKGLPRNQQVSPFYLFHHNGKAAITIRDSGIVIHDTIEAAAVALANAILETKKLSNSPSASWGSVVAWFKDDGITVHLNSPWAMNEEEWKLLKKDVEKICNGLTAFM